MFSNHRKKSVDKTTAVTPLPASGGTHVAQSGADQQAGETHRLERTRRAMRTHRSKPNMRLPCLLVRSRRCVVIARPVRCRRCVLIARRSRPGHCLLTSSPRFKTKCNKTSGCSMAVVPSWGGCSRQSIGNTIKEK